MKWVLLYYLTSPWSLNGITAHSHDFTTRAGCQAAAAQVVEKWGGRAVCIQDGTEPTPQKKQVM